MKEELCRKLIHFVGLGYIPLYIYTGKDITLLIVAGLTAFAALLEIARRRYGIFPRWILRSYEVNGIGAYLYFGISATLITALLPMEACFAGIVLGSLGDGIAGILKRADMRHLAYPSMFLISLLALTLLDLNPIASFLACIAGVTAERCERIGRYYLNDNLTVPILSAFVYFVVITLLTV
ncbi:hypothetical protein [Archaeoglobus veneficus]|uniref:Dolichol kinase n=1 Tax=Archaeoglobus veneficus (strain DSM 11195 / SNP6) TaxID=693661 RepID=F2KQW3_ARCVS|nr:hypothetical protein [Archaeoglobus veneficus]AEA47769.1 hypothetical protein Arcve_1772 [Archaeoglobus veneficus SNP6]